LRGRVDETAAVLTILAQLLESYAEGIFTFMEKVRSAPFAPTLANRLECDVRAQVFTDPNTADFVRRAGLGTLGDVVHALGPKVAVLSDRTFLPPSSLSSTPQVKRYLQKDWVRHLITKSLKDPHRGTKEVATWVKSVCLHCPSFIIVIVSHRLAALISLAQVVDSVK
jgi:hypothetical protein